MERLHDFGEGVGVAGVEAEDVGAVGVGQQFLQKVAELRVLVPGAHPCPQRGQKAAVLAPQLPNLLGE